MVIVGDQVSRGVRVIRVQVVKLGVVVTVSGALYLEESLDEVQRSDVVVRQPGTNPPLKQHVTWNSQMATSLAFGSKAISHMSIRFSDFLLMAPKFYLCPLRLIF